MLYRYITPYTTYLPFDIKTYFYSKLRMDDPDKQKEFNKNYEEYEKRIFANFVHEHQFYYVVSVVYNEKKSSIKIFEILEYFLRKYCNDIIYISLYNNPR